MTMTKLAKHKPLIYAVDDDEDDRYLLQTVFSKHFPECTLRQFEDGAGLLVQLTHRLDGQLPDLIILDLQMPLFSGFELLRYLREDDCFSSIPIVILSACQHPENIKRGYTLGMISYINKAQPYRQLVSAIRCLEDYWSPENQLPISVVKQPRCLIKELSLLDLSFN